MVAAGRSVLDGDALTLQEAADQLNVHYMTAYRWVRSGKLQAFKAGGRLRVRSEDLRSFAQGREVDVVLPARASGRRNWKRHVERLHGCLLDGRAVEAGTLVAKVVANGATATDAYIHLITPALYRVGDDWADGRIGIAVEHRATEIATRLMISLSGLFQRPGPSRGVAVTVAPEGEQHGLGLAMVADFLRGMHFTVHHLGCNLPADQLACFLRREPADLVCVSVTNLTLATEPCAQLINAAHHESDAIVFVGGQAADPRVVEAAGGIYAPTLAELQAQLEEAPKDPPKSSRG
jgi:MerR family transcriptional regulator, light-induced transcriptional regulator